VLLVEFTVAGQEFITTVRGYQLRSRSFRSRP
jgi:hypothetical protein